jgi:hypothetical protein
MVDVTPELQTIHSLPFKELRITPLSPTATNWLPVHATSLSIDETGVGEITFHFSCE